MDWSILIIILQLVFLEGILSIDNAAVIGAMVSPLPDDEPIPFPKFLQKFEHRIHPLLGNQRTAALRVGLLGAYLGRGIMLALASVVIHNPWLKIVGAIYLIRLAFDDLSPTKSYGEDEATQTVKSAGFWITVLNVEMMDLVFSLDNVVAAVSLSEKLWVVMIGVAIGIITMRFAAGAFSYIIEKEPILKSAAYILVFNIGVELLLEELAGFEISDWMRFSISLLTILLTLAYGHIKFLRILRPLLIWISQGFSNFNAIIDWALVPVIGTVKLIWNILNSMIRRPEKA